MGFRGWHERYGDRDEHEELRVSIIEGDIPGREAGYSVNISTDLDVFIERLRAAGYEYNDDLLWSISRINRMHPAPGSVNLETFKRNVKRNKTYVLVPVVYRSETDVEIIPGLGILKNKVLFRRVEDVNENDPDIAVMAREQDG